jgi:two-component system, response regulator / RNA-binding antiterminator
MNTPTPLRVLLVDDTAREVGFLREALAGQGFQVVNVQGSAFELSRGVAAVNPDVIIIDTESPSRDVLEQVCVVTRDDPRPVVMFTADAGNASIQAALRAGVAAYVVDGVDRERLHSILQVAMARFEIMRDLHQQLAQAQSRLDERKLIERAKGLIMKSRGANEDEAYRLLRKLAMDRGARLIEVARQVIEVADLLA